MITLQLCTVVMSQEYDKNYYNRIFQSYIELSNTNTKEFEVNFEYTPASTKDNSKYTVNLKSEYNLPIPLILNLGKIIGSDTILTNNIKF